MPDEIFDIREAALYFGCSPQLLIKLRRFGWLRSVEGVRDRHVKVHQTHYRRSDLDNLAWDYMFSLSMYEVLALRMNLAPDLKRIAQSRGIPLKVVELVHSCEVAGVIVELVRDQGRIWHKKDTLSSMTMFMKKLFDRSAPGPRRDREIPATKRWWEDCGPIRNLEINRSNFHGPSGACAPTCNEADTNAINANRHLLLPDQRLPISGQLSAIIHPTNTLP